MAHPFRGPTARLVLSLDVGTTYSGVSYCILDPGVVPKICSVTRYPGQEHASGSPKIPSILYYDAAGDLRAVGAEALLDRNLDSAEEEGWLKVEWFKLRMRPKSMPSKLQTSTLPPLPANKNVVQVFGDMLRYLMSCVEKFILETHPTVIRSWDVLRQGATFVTAHPNGWEGVQQAKLRRAAVLGGLVPDTLEGRSRVVFVTEGEASLHYCVRGGFVDSSQRGFIVADLGGGTLDFSAYRVVGTKPLRVDEVTQTKCDLEGSTFVTQRAKTYLKRKLADSSYGSDDHVKQIAERFDETTKRTFRNTVDVCLIPFGSTMDRDLAHGIRAGKMKLSGEEVAAFFEPSVSATMAAIKGYITESPITMSALYLVGGFSASPYLMDQLKERLHACNARMSINCPDGQTAKAVAEGSLSFYLDHYVSARVAKMTYGVRGSRTFVPTDPEHQRRASNIWTRPSGEVMVRGAFFPVLERGTTVSEEREFRESFSTETRDKGSVKSVQFAVTAYRGLDKPPEWADGAGGKGLFKTLFYVSADLHALQRVLQEKKALDGAKYWKYEYELAIYYGGPEVTAQVVWWERGVERRGPAQVIYEGAYDDEEDEETEKVIPEDERLRPARVLFTQLTLR